MTKIKNLNHVPYQVSKLTIKEMYFNDDPFIIFFDVNQMKIPHALPSDINKYKFNYKFFCINNLTFRFQKFSRTWEIYEKNPCL